MHIVDMKVAGIDHVHFYFSLSHHITIYFAAFGHKHLARCVFQGAVGQFLESFPMKAGHAAYYETPAIAVFFLS